MDVVRGAHVNSWQITSHRVRHRLVKQRHSKRSALDDNFLCLPVHCDHCTFLVLARLLYQGVAFSMPSYFANVMVTQLYAAFVLPLLLHRHFGVYVYLCAYILSLMSRLDAVSKMCGCTFGNAAITGKVCYVLVGC